MLKLCLHVHVQSCFFMLVVFTCCVHVCVFIISSETVKMRSVSRMDGTPPPVSSQAVSAIYSTLWLFLVTNASIFRKMTCGGWKKTFLQLPWTSKLTVSVP